MARTRHDRALFEILLSNQRELEPELRAGAMFGCPAAFIGSSLAFCVYGDAVGAKVPEADAARLIAAGAATAFRPYQRQAMREWIELRPTDAAAREVTEVLALAVRHARARNAAKKPVRRS